MRANGIGIFYYRGNPRRSRLRCNSNDSCRLHKAPCPSWAAEHPGSIAKSKSKRLTDRQLLEAPAPVALDTLLPVRRPSKSSSSSSSSSTNSVSFNTPACLTLAPSRRGLLLAAASALALGFPGPGGCPPAVARLLHSKRSDVACSLTVRNWSPRLVEALWVNYDGDEELYATIPPSHVWTVDTYETHPWRFRDARTGGVVCEYVAQRGDRLLQLYDDPAGLLDLDPDSNNSSSSSSGTPAAPDGEPGAAVRDAPGGGESRRRLRQKPRRQPSQYGHPEAADTEPDQVAASSSPSSSPQHPSPANHLAQPPRSQTVSQPPPKPQQLQAKEQPQQAPSSQQQQQQQLEAAGSEGPGLAGGFDGLGNSPELYTLASLVSVAVLPREAQAVVVLGLEGFEHPLSLLVGVPEARNIVNAAGAARGRRPTLLATWLRSLQALGGTLQRVVITRQVGGVFYARIVLRQPCWGTRPVRGAAGASKPPQAKGPVVAEAGGAMGGSSSAESAGGRELLVSVDARPSDALALAVEAGAEVFVSLPVADQVQQQYLDAEKDFADRLLPPALELQQQQPGGEREGGGSRGGRLLAEGLLGVPSA